jgi:hypothetical protein
LGKPALAKGEKPAEYEALLNALEREVNPSDVIEWLWVKDIAELTWDIVRYRRLKTNHFERSTARVASFGDIFPSDINTLETLERLTASVEARRNNALYEIERRRNALGRALREASDKIIDAEAPLVPSLPGS